ncbi:MAG: nucleoside triphosphate pyrophosphohydrolase [Deltaproteobacteria bacterium]|nr:nucleoside triphosphate pyrophosphohydrolase [Deltaproteobacteria bacterium]
MDRGRVAEAFLDLIDLVKQLRGPDGCPWDREQSDSSIKTYVLEEAYEVLDAIEKGVPDEVCQELGDLLFQILFLADMAEERGQFGFLEVLEKIKKKMVERHPHVFGESRAETPEEVSQNWARIKERERGGNSNPLSVLEGVPTGLPALQRAHRLSERAWRLGFLKEDVHEKWLKVEKAMEGLKECLAGHGNEGADEKLGVLLFTLADLARHLGLNAENSLRSANSKFLDSVQNR